MLVPLIDTVAPIKRSPVFLSLKTPFITVGV
jgi:hypothetical protein